MDPWTTLSKPGSSGRQRAPGVGVGQEADGRGAGAAAVPRRPRNAEAAQGDPGGGGRPRGTGGGRTETAAVDGREARDEGVAGAVRAQAGGRRSVNLVQLRTTHASHYATPVL